MLPCMHTYCVSLQLLLQFQHTFFPMIVLIFTSTFLLSTSACCQQAPNTDMWLISSHLILLSFLGLLGDRLELFLELCCFCQCLCSLLLDGVHYLGFHFVIDQSCTFFLGLFYLYLNYLYLCEYFGYSFLQ
jgi:hypothetical protein